MDNVPYSSSSVFGNKFKELAIVITKKKIRHERKLMILTYIFFAIYLLLLIKEKRKTHFRILNFGFYEKKRNYFSLKSQFFFLLILEKTSVGT